MSLRLSSVVNDCPTAASSPIVRVTANNSGGRDRDRDERSNRGRSSPVSFLSSISSSISNSTLGGSNGAAAGGGGGAVAAAMTTQ